MKISKRRVLALLAGLSLGIGIGLGTGIFFDPREAPAPAVSSSSEKKPLFYRHPMKPTVTSPVPIKDNMGMDYVPVYAEDEGGGGPPGTVSIDPVTVQNIGVRTAKAEKRALSRVIHTLGRVTYDEERLTRLHPKIEGWIEKMFVSETGAVVTEGTELVAIYSPQLVSSQQEYLLALKGQKTLKDSPYPDIREGAGELLRTSRERLELLDVPEHQIEMLEQTRKIEKTLHIHSPFDGIVLSVGVREGQFVTPKTELYQIADLSRVWAYVNVYEHEIPWVQEGDRAEMRLASLPGRIFRGTITYIYPYLERQSRSVQVRLEFDNPDLELKPDMFANVILFPNRRTNAVVIPEEAVLRSGMHKRVFVVRAPGKFEPREVTLGVSAHGEVEVLEGLKAGENVVISGQFLIDSESSIREAATKMMEPKKPEPATPGAAPENSGMEMPAPKAGPAPDGATVTPPIVSPKEGGHD
jgi:Cu(I)/Ag(I) efflux system membrane fusion protein